MLKHACMDETTSDAIVKQRIRNFMLFYSDFDTGKLANTAIFF